MFNIYTMFRMLITYIMYEFPTIPMMFKVFAILECIAIYTIYTVVAIFVICIIFIAFKMNKISIVDRIKIIALSYRYKDLIKVVIPFFFAASALLAGLVLGEKWRSSTWWAIGVALTVITLLVNLFIEWVYYQMDSRDANNYSRFIECLLKYNKKNTNHECKNEHTHIISDIWEPILGKDCRVSYYVLDVPDEKGDEWDLNNELVSDLSMDKIISSGAILKAKEYNDWAGRGHMELTVEDKEQLKSIITSMWSKKEVYYDDIRLSKYSKELKEMNIDPNNKKYVSFVRIPVGNYKGSGMAIGVLIADSSKSCYFRKDGFNYKFAQYVAQVIESLYCDSKDYSDDTAGREIGKFRK